MTKHEDTRHMAEKIAADLRFDILSGELAPGVRIPTIGALAQRYGVAHTTAQRALAVLKGERLLVSRPGVSVCVRERESQTIRPAEYMAPAAPGEPHNWITQAQQRGQTGGARLIDVAEVEAPKRVSRVLELPEGSPVIARSRVGLLDGEPAEYSISYYTLDIARDTPLAVKRKIKGGSPTLLADMGLPLRRQFTELTARIATPAEHTFLELPGNPPVLESFCVVYTDGDRPVEVTVLIKPGHRFRMGFDVPA